MNQTEIKRPKHIIDLIDKLFEFWKKNGSQKILPLNTFAGAATFHPQCIFGSLNNKKQNIVYIGHGVRHDDKTGGTSPHRYLQHIQLQVLWKNPPENILELYKESLKYIGIDVENRLMRYLNSSWATESFGAGGYGLEISCDLLEITQFTYFLRMCDIKLQNIPIEITYGIERLALILWPEYEHINDIPWNDDMTYGEMRLFEEKDRSEAITILNKKNDIQELLNNVEILINQDNVFGSFYELLYINDKFNILNANRKLNHHEKINYIKKIRELVNKIGIKYQSFT